MRRTPISPDPTRQGSRSEADCATPGLILVRSALYGTRAEPQRLQDEFFSRSECIASSTGSSVRAARADCTFKYALGKTTRYLMKILTMRIPCAQCSRLCRYFQRIARLQRHGPFTRQRDVYFRLGALAIGDQSVSATCTLWSSRWHRASCTFHFGSNDSEDGSFWGQRGSLRGMSVKKSPFFCLWGVLRTDGAALAHSSSAIIYHYSLCHYQLVFQAGSKKADWHIARLREELS